MDKIINIKVRNRIAIADPDQCIICGNEDYVAVFEFDDEWNEIETKTARFYRKNNFTDVIFTGNEVTIPEMVNVSSVKIGVFAGDMTTTPAVVRCYKSILCDGGNVAEPDPDVYDQIIKMIENLKVGEGGGPGVSPTVEVVKIEGGHRITITDINGTSSIDVMDGSDGLPGEPGADGKDGISPTVSVSKSGKVTTISITDKNGTKTATINDGADGNPGAAGSNGKDGKTPVRFVDYWTPADQEAIVQQVIAALGTPVFGTVDEDCNINLTGALADGKTYTFTYEDENGNVATIGTYTKTAAPTYTNILDVYDIQYNKRFSPSSMGYKDAVGLIAFAIPWQDVWNKTLRLKGFANIISSGSSSAQVHAISGSTSKPLAGIDETGVMFTSPYVTKSGDVYSLPINSTTLSGATSGYDRLQIQLVLNSTGASVSAADLTGRIITIDEEITD